ncbi:hypothetical protein L615_003500000190 [Nocardioides sp. J9]|uniref:hypothetical protein n=1 Tax=Nocardioides sp. J9 TaxID=935844 RepID=UPI00119F7B91|nr:hypothetical protein [Nocardioides sp. J9]TWG97401.1 hypothetical protein L615_003500000190 [Nocardioides sp. J9]
MKLHQSLADLARDHGHDLFRDATAFRGSLDDYLDEGQASSGTINLLTDAVRLGALDGMVTMLDSGANPADAVESAGQRLARDRGSADVRGCQWAVAVLGYALGKVPEHLVTGLDPDAGTTAPPPPVPPVQSPGHSPVASPGQPPAPSPVTSPVAHPQQPGVPRPARSGGGSQPTPPKKGKTGLVIGAVALVLVLVIGGIIAAVALSGDDDPERKATDDPTPTDTQSTPGSDVPDIGGDRFEGLGYEVQVPKGWTDGTEEFKSQNSNTSTLDKVLLWGDTFNTARGNVIIETQSSYGYTDPNDLKDNWKTALVSGDSSAEINDAANISIDGQTALTVDIARTNDSNVDVVQRSHLVISGDKGYSITVSLKAGDDDVLEEFDKILSTWQWQG